MNGLNEWAEKVDGTTYTGVFFNQKIPIAKGAEESI